jgi:tetrapyrrole methylase family protein/MazG family protein
MPSKSRHSIPSEDFRDFVKIVRRLRKECPWDRKQTHRSLRHSLIEETYEVVHALDRGDLKELSSELGDLLLHVIMQATIAEEEGEFTLQEVLRLIRAKLIRRHPHVFGTRRVRSAEEVKRNWENIKMEEGRTSLLDGIPRSMPALQRALRMQQRASKVGFDWETQQQVWEKLSEELQELRVALERKRPREREEEFGDFLFALVNYARFISIHPEDALRQTVEKFDRRFRYIEQNLRKQGKDIHSVTLAEMDRLWNAAKRKKR